jgi:hypothetical protein
VINVTLKKVGHSGLANRFTGHARPTRLLGDVHPAKTPAED